jgi:hypothetical protein
VIATEALIFLATEDTEHTENKKLYNYWGKNMCEWNDLFQENSSVIKADLGGESEKGQINAPNKSGVYVVRVMSPKKKNKTKPIQRIFQPDKDGILHLGHTKNLKVRIRSFLRGTRTGKEHSEAMRYHRLKDKYKRYGYSLVQIGYLKLSLKKSKKLELEWFEKYSRDFGELPPLNSKCG